MPTAFRSSYRSRFLRAEGQPKKKPRSACPGTIYKECLNYQKLFFRARSSRILCFIVLRRVLLRASYSIQSP